MNESKDFLGRGFTFPPQIDSTTGKFRMVDTEEDIKQAVYIILMTKTKERAMVPDFGCSMNRYIFELPDATFEHLICSEIQEALADWEPRIRNIEVTINTMERKNGKIYLTVKYVVRATNNPNNLVFPYYLDEGVGTI